MIDSNSAKLESCELDSKFSAVQPKGYAIRDGGKCTEFHFFSNKVTQDGVPRLVEIVAAHFLGFELRGLPGPECGVDSLRMPFSYFNAAEIQSGKWLDAV